MLLHSNVKMKGDVKIDFTLRVLKTMFNIIANSALALNDDSIVEISTSRESLSAQYPISPAISVAV